MALRLTALNDSGAAYESEPFCGLRRPIGLFFRLDILHQDCFVGSVPPSALYVATGSALVGCDGLGKLVFFLESLVRSCEKRLGDAFLGRPRGLASLVGFSSGSASGCVSAAGSEAPWLVCSGSSGGAVAPAAASSWARSAAIAQARKGHSINALPLTTEDDVGYFSHIVLGREWSPFSGRWWIGQDETIQSEKGPNDAEQ
ncbi:MAG: hypothetical protein RBS72_02950, partial [Sedimentisphaerales bacterium]|nr:hypothetical protein [Sedimentisphaerales bacterium]